MSQKIFDNSFDRMLYSLVLGETKQLSTALDKIGFSSFGMEIPIAYGLSVSLHAPYIVDNWIENDTERFICDKILKLGGAVAVKFSWLGIHLIDSLIYFNDEIGLITIIKPRIEGLAELKNNGTDSGAGYTQWFQYLAGNQNTKLINKFGRRDYNELYKMQEVLANKVESEFNIKFIPILWYDIEESFNIWYYSGALRRGSLK